MSTSSDRPGSGPEEQPVTQTGRPPVPRPAPTDPGDPRDDDGVQRTEQVPFPLPPLRAGSPPPVAGPPTGQLDLGGYPPRVPGAGRGRPDDGDPGDGDDPDDGAPDGR